MAEEVDYRSQAIELQVTHAGRGNGLADGDGIIKTRVEIQETIVDRDDAIEASLGVQVHRTAAGFHESNGATESEGGIKIENRSGQDVELRSLGGRAAQADLDIGGTALDEHGGGVGQRQGDIRTVHAVATEAARQARSERGGNAIDGQRIDRRGNAKRHITRKAGVLLRLPGGGRGIEVARHQGAPSTSVVDKETITESVNGRGGEDVATDGQGGPGSSLPCDQIGVGHDKLGGASQACDDE